jgi:putative FmdB family regulatory protein
MPTYEYKCKKCGYTFEKFQSITAKPLQHCPKCNGEVFRLISKNGSFILKGSGYYSTDNRKIHTLKENKGISGRTTKGKTGKPVTATEEKKTVTPKSEK